MCIVLNRFMTYNDNMPNISHQPLPDTAEAIHQQLDGMFQEEQAVQATRWANYIVSMDLYVSVANLGLLRQCFRYMPASSIVCYMGSALSLKEPDDFRRFWIGDPPDWSGTVRMMETTFDAKGWKAAFFPRIRPGYSTQEAARMLALFQQDGPPQGNERRAPRDDVFLTAFIEDPKLSNRADLQFWSEPSTWLANHRLSLPEQIQVWSAYALLADPEILTKVAKLLRWTGWDVARHFVDWEAVTSPLASIRLRAANDLVTLHRDKIQAQSLPDDLVLVL